MGLVANAVPGLLGRGAVVAKPIGLDNETKVRPVEVDTEPAQAPAGLRLIEPRATRYRKEEPFELGVGEGEGCAVEQSKQDTSASPARALLELPAHGLRVDQVELVSLVDGGLELAGREHGGEIDEGADGVGHRYPEVDFGLEFGAAMDPDSGPLRVTVRRNGDIYRAHAPGTPEAVESTPEAVQATSCHPMGDRIRVETKFKQLTPGDDAVLSRRQGRHRGERRLERRLNGFLTYGS